MYIPNNNGHVFLQENQENNFSKFRKQKLDVVPFLQERSLKFMKNIAKPVSDIYRSFIRNNGLFFGQIASETDFE